MIIKKLTLFAVTNAVLNVFAVLSTCDGQQNWTVTPSYTNVEVGVSSRPLTIPGSDGKPRTLYSDSQAVLIFQGTYKDRAWQSVQDQADSDERALSQRLQQFGFTVNVWRNLEAQQLSVVLREAFARLGHRPNTRVFFYYFGHGFSRDEDGSDSPSYMVGVDAPSPDQVEEFYAKVVSFEELLSYARSLEVKHAFFIVEACRAGSFLLSLAAPPVATPQNYLLSDDFQSPIRQFLTAGSPGRNVPAKGPFTQRLVDALNSPDADLNKDGYITASEVATWIKSNVSRDSQGSQVPVYGSWRPGSTGDFVFGAVRGRSGRIARIPLIIGNKVTLTTIKLHTTQQSFSFNDNQVGSVENHSWDIATADGRSGDPPQQGALFLPFDAAPYLTGDHARGGIGDAPVQSLEAADDCPFASEYKSHWFKPELDHVYCVRIRNGNSFGKIAVRDISKDGVSFDWVYQPSTLGAGTLVEYIPLQNPTTGLSLLYPSSVLPGVRTRGGEPPDLAEVAFENADASAVLRTFTIPSAQPMQSLRQEDESRMRAEGWRDFFETGSDSAGWYVISGRNERQIIYSRRQISLDRQRVHGFSFRYPSDKEGYFSQVVDVLSHSLRQ